MKNLNKKIDDFLNNSKEYEAGEEVCDIKSGVCYIKTKDGLIERKVIEQKLMTKDGKELLREETPISNSGKIFLR